MQLPGALHRLLRSGIENGTFPVLGPLTRPGLHEGKILNQLGKDRVSFTGSAPEFKGRLILLAFTNRSGSTLLGEYMRQTGMIHGLGEFSNHDFVIRQMEKAQLNSFPDLIRHLNKGRKPHQIFGIKASWDQITMLVRWNIPAMFEEVRVVHISRRDILAQAISYAIASQTKQWTSTQKTNGSEPVFDANALDLIMAEQQSQDARIRLVCQLFDIPNYAMTYEGLCANPTGHMRAVLTFCGVPRPKWEAVTPQLKKQAGLVNERFRDAYLEIARGQVLKGKEGTGSL